MQVTTSQAKVRERLASAKKAPDEARVRSHHATHSPRGLRESIEISILLRRDCRNDSPSSFSCVLTLFARARENSLVQSAVNLDHQSRHSAPVSHLPFLFFRSSQANPGRVFQLLR